MHEHFRAVHQPTGHLWATFLHTALSRHDRTDYEPAASPFQARLCGGAAVRNARAIGSQQRGPLLFPREWNAPDLRCHIHLPPGKQRWVISMPQISQTSRTMFEVGIWCMELNPQMNGFRFTKTAHISAHSTLGVELPGLGRTQISYPGTEAQHSPRKTAIHTSQLAFHP